MKQKEKSLQTKEKIIAAAMNLFIEKGYQATTMSDIVKRTGLSKGGVYHQFASKEAILEQAMSEEVAKVTQFFEELSADQELSAQQRLRDLLEFFSRKQTLQDLSHIDWAEKIPFGLLFTLRNTLQNLSTYVGTIIEQGNRQGEFACPYSLETASVFLLLIDVWLDPLIVGRDFSVACKKIDYIAYFLKISQLPLLSEEDCDWLKETVRPYYIGGS